MKEYEITWNDIVAYKQKPDNNNEKLASYIKRTKNLPDDAHLRLAKRALNGRKISDVDFRGISLFYVFGTTFENCILYHIGWCSGCKFFKSTIQDISLFKPPTFKPFLTFILLSIAAVNAVVYYFTGVVEPFIILTFINIIMELTISELDQCIVSNWFYGNKTTFVACNVGIATYLDRHKIEERLLKKTSASNYIIINNKGSAVEVSNLMEAWFYSMLIRLTKSDSAMALSADGELHTFRYFAREVTEILKSAMYRENNIIKKELLKVASKELYKALLRANGENSSFGELYDDEILTKIKEYSEHHHKTLKKAAVKIIGHAMDVRFRPDEHNAHRLFMSGPDTTVCSYIDQNTLIRVTRCIPLEHSPITTQRGK
jgi:hypothetical protein